LHIKHDSLWQEIMEEKNKLKIQLLKVHNITIQNNNSIHGSSKTINFNTTYTWKYYFVKYLTLIVKEKTPMNRINMLFILKRHQWDLVP